MVKLVLVCVSFLVAHVMCNPALGPCHKKKAALEARRAIETFVGWEMPRCEADGSFKGMQFSGSQAVCVTKTGNNIDRYTVNRGATGLDMNCLCARDEYDYQQLGMIGKMHSCELNGNYASTGCTGSVCYCQDKYGKQVGTSTVNIGLQDSLNC